MDPYKRSVLSTIEQEDEENDDEQVKKTLHFFDSILDEYLQDQDNDGKRASRSNYSQSALNLSSNKIATKTKEFNPSERKNSSAFHKYIPRQTSSQVRRYTSENNLDQLHLLPKSAPLDKSYRSSLLHSTATSTSTEDLTNRNSSKKTLSASQTNLPTLNEQVTPMGITASLIDLSQHQQSKTGPLFRFVPPKESKIDATPKKKYPPNIVKPMVIMPNITFAPLTTPSIRSTDNHFHHENGVSPFKPLVSSKTNPTNESSNIHVGLTNPSAVAPPPPLVRPQFHQSMMNLPVQSNESATKHTHYIRQANPTHRPARYYPGAGTSSLLTEPVNKWLQQMKDSSTINPHPPTRYYPSNGYSTTGSMMNEFDHRQRTQYYSRPTYVPQGNIYHFDAKPPIPAATRVRTSQSSHSHGNDLIVTTYL